MKGKNKERVEDVIEALNRLEKNQGKPYQEIEVANKVTCFHRIKNVGLIVKIEEDIRSVDAFWFFDETLR